MAPRVRLLALPSGQAQVGFVGPEAELLGLPQEELLSTAP
jgi:hypothetical protein